MKTLSIIHAPGVNKMDLKLLIVKMKDFIERLGLGESDFHVNPTNLKVGIGNIECAETVVIGWGLPAIPAWTKWMSENMVPPKARHLLAIDLFERDGIDRKASVEPVVTRGKYDSKTIPKSSLRLFMEGCYVKSAAPFGMKRVATEQSKSRKNPKCECFKLVPGELEEIEIVRLIFDLFVHHNYTLTKICNLLNAQGVKSPNIRHVWRTKTVRAVLTCFAYIGANEFCGYFKLGVFPPVVDRSIFFEAQAKLNQGRVDLPVPGNQLTIFEAPPNPE